MRKESKLRVGDRVWGTIIGVRKEMVVREVGTIIKIQTRKFPPADTYYTVEYADGLTRNYHSVSLQRINALEKLAEL